MEFNLCAENESATRKNEITSVYPQWNCIVATRLGGRGPKAGLNLPLMQFPRNLVTLEKSHFWTGTLQERGEKGKAMPCFFPGRSINTLEAFQQSCNAPPRADNGSLKSYTYVFFWVQSTWFSTAQFVFECDNYNLHLNHRIPEETGACGRIRSVRSFE